MPWWLGDNDDDETDEPTDPDEIDNTGCQHANMKTGDMVRRLRLERSRITPSLRGRHTQLPRRGDGPRQTRLRLAAAGSLPIQDDSPVTTPDRGFPHLSGDKGQVHPSPPHRSRTRPGRNRDHGDPYAKASSRTMAG